MADLRELEPFDERGVVQHMGSDVRAFFFFWIATDSAFHLHGCYDSASSIAVGAGLTVGL